MSKTATRKDPWQWSTVTGDVQFLLYTRSSHTWIVSDWTGHLDGLDAYDATGTLSSSSSAGAPLTPFGGSSDLSGV